MNPEDKKYILDNIGKKSIKTIAGDLRLKEKVVRRVVEGGEKPKPQNKPTPTLRKISAEPISSIFAPMTLVRFLQVALILFAVAFIAYSSSFQNEFVFDDKIFISADPYIHDLSHWNEFFAHNQGFSGGARNNFYRPIYSLLNAIDYKIGGGAPFVFHITNTLIHWAAGVAVFALMLSIYDNILVAFGTAVFFILHPVQTQAVSYIAGRADPIYSLFVLLTLICYIAYFKRRQIHLLVCALSAFIIALLSKEGAIIAPFFLILYIYTFNDQDTVARRKNLFLTIPIFLTTGIYLLLRATILNFSKIPHSGLVVVIPPFYVRALTACKAIVMYLKYLFIPVNFHLETFLPNSRSLFESTTFGAVLVVIAVLTFLIYTRKRNKLLFFGLAWFFIGLFPVLNLFPINAPIAVHWLYLPSVGFFFGLNVIMWKALSGRSLNAAAQRRAKYIFIAIVAIIACVLGMLTFQKNKEWKDEETLYLKILPHAQTPRILINLGNVYLRRNDFDKATDCYYAALKIAPTQAEAYVNLGYIYSAKKDFRKAEEVLTKAIQLDPRQADAYFNLAVAHANMGKFREAIQEIETSLSLKPINANALVLLGEVYLNTGERQKAKEAFQRSLVINNDQPAIKNKLSTL